VSDSASHFKVEDQVSCHFAAPEMARQLLAWYDRAGRELPWRKTRDAYRIWLAEIMLQQTTVATVVEYYQRFLQQFPTLEHLAAAPLEQVIDLWAGLGYYARARNLHATAQKLVAEYGGVFPASPPELMRLPGIGRSTAGAIVALAFDQRAAILDGNVRRILCRLFALQEPPRSTPAEKKLWAWAEALTPWQRVHDYTQAIMDLGALVCTPSAPKCEDCPLAPLCRALSLGLTRQLPLKMAGKKGPLRRQLALLLVAGESCLVRRRPPTGLLGGLWEFPTLEAAGQPPAAAICALLAGQMTFETPELLGGANHTYSHFQLEIDFYRVEVEPQAQIAESGDCWLPLNQLSHLALHGAHKKLLPLIGH
jgi:A/G-specific adenine glycosylase